MKEDVATGSGAEAALVAYALAYRVLLQRAVPEIWQVPVNVGAALGALAIAHHSGASLSDCGVGGTALGSGLRTGAGAAAVTAAGITIASRPKLILQMFCDDQITGYSRARSSYEVLVRIPLGTALGEEVLFRGALLAVMRRRHSPAAAAVWNALWFGAWHVPPTMASLSNAVAGQQEKSLASAVLETLAVVGATAVAGVALAGLRLRSRSVLAPVIAHAALNGTAYLVARRASRS